jgi:serine/threonine protein kinase
MRKKLYEMVSSSLFCAICGALNAAGATRCFACGELLSSTGNTNAQSEQILAQRYQIVERLGQGGMGVVYKVRDMRLGNRFLAIKEMRLSGLDQQQAAEAIEGFKREALLISELMHPHLPRIYDYFTEVGCWYLVMDYIEGETLERYLAAHGSKLSLDEVLTMALQLCDVLDYLHTRQPPIIFRDLKPDNIMRTAQGHLYLIDFGIARHFKPGQARDTIAFGSPGYAAPEQYGKQQTTPQADIYSLGALLHQLLTGDDPSLSPFVFAPLPPGVGTERLQRLLTQMVALDIHKRPQSIAIVKQELEAIAAEKPQITISISSISSGVSVPTFSGNIFSLATGARSEPSPLICIYSGMHMDWVSSLAWSSDGLNIVSGSYDKTVQIWHATSARTYLVYRGHAERWHGGQVNAVAGCPRGAAPGDEYIASASDDGTVQVWCAANGELRTIYREHREKVFSVCWSPDGQWLASASRSAIHIWLPTSGATMHDITERKGIYRCVSWSPDGACLAVSRGAEVLLYDISAGFQKQSVRWRYQGHSAEIHALAWSPDSTRIASASNDKTVQIRDASHGHLLYLHLGHTAQVTALAWSPDGKYLASAGVDGVVQILDVARWRVILTYKDHYAVIYALAWSPDGTRIASGDVHRAVHVWYAP